MLNTLSIKAIKPSSTQHSRQSYIHTSIHPSIKILINPPFGDECNCSEAHCEVGEDEAEPTAFARVCFEALVGLFGVVECSIRTFASGLGSSRSGQGVSRGKMTMSVKFGEMAVGWMCATLHRL